MNKPYKDTGMTRYEIAKKTLREQNQNFPDLGHNIGFYLYTKWKELMPVQPYSREKFEMALDMLPEKPKAATQLHSGLRKLDSVLANLTGKTSVFLYTDGTYSESDAVGISPISIATKLAKKYDVCFYVISTADDYDSKKVTDKLGNVNFCARTIAFSDFIENPEYNSGALYTVRSTEEIETVTDIKVVGAKVNNILFEFDKAEISPEFSEHLNQVGEFMKQNPNSYAVLHGYTDSTGSEEYNYGLSRQRAESVSNYLEAKFNVGAERLIGQWYGPLNPVADNGTAEGRNLNRRVEVAVGMK
jgi:OOP family OmpA-OmpF porin